MVKMEMASSVQQSFRHQRYITLEKNIENITNHTHCLNFTLPKRYQF